MAALSLQRRHVAADRLIASLSCFTISATGPKSVPHVLQIIDCKTKRFQLGLILTNKGVQKCITSDHDKYRNFIRAMQ